MVIVNDLRHSHISLPFHPWVFNACSFVSLWKKHSLELQIPCEVLLFRYPKATVPKLLGAQGIVSTTSSSLQNKSRLYRIPNVSPVRYFTPNYPLDLIPLFRGDDLIAAEQWPKKKAILAMTYWMYTLKCIPVVFLFNSPLKEVLWADIIFLFLSVDHP